MTSLLQIPDAMTAPANWTAIDSLTYELDPFQKHAVLAIQAGDHVFVTAKTGSGKTFVGEYLIRHCLAKGQRVFYTTPIKSLSNQKYHDLKKLFSGVTVGILTGDIKMCPDAQIVVMTAEILRNLFYKLGTATEKVGLTSAISLENVGGIVMDEVHYIQDPDRGHVWEETLILAAKRPIALVLLSATLPSAASLAGWLAELHQRRTWLLSTTYRIVPLVHGLLDSNSKVRPLLDTQGRWIGDTYTGWLRDRKAVSDAAVAHKKAVAARARDGYSGPVVKATDAKVETPTAQLLRTVAWLNESGGLPALFFVFSRKECERYAALMAGSLIDSSDSAAAAHIIDFHLSRHRATLEKSPQYHRIRDLLCRGIGFHHSGLQPLLKEIVEILFTRGYVKVLFATETFSVGLNMPTKTVVFLELEKWCDTGSKRMLRPDEYIQMAGRAGRRGLDTQGLVLYVPMRDPVDSSDLKGLLTGALPPLQSRMRFHYDFILKQHLTSGSGSGSDSVDIVGKSYWAVQQQATRRSLGLELAALDQRLDLLSSGLSEKLQAAFAERAILEQEVAQSVNAKRKKAQQALNRWLADNETKDMSVLGARYQELCNVRAERQRTAVDIDTWDSAPLLSLDSQESCLATWGFLSLRDDTYEITPLGTAATEVNEGHPILMPLLANSEKLDGYTAEQVAIVLATFIQDGTEEATVPSELIGVLNWIADTARTCERDEDRARVFSPRGYWTLSSLWPAIVARWLDGSNPSLSQIAAEFDIFEGNVQRGLMRVSNLLDEWSAIAMLRRDLIVLEKMVDLDFLRNELTTDSIYLRL